MEAELLANKHNTTVTYILLCTVHTVVYILLYNRMAQVDFAEEEASAMLQKASLMLQNASLDAGYQMCPHGSSTFK